MYPLLAWGGPAILLITYVVWYGYLNAKYEAGRGDNSSPYGRALWAAGYTALTALGLVLSGAVLGVIHLLLMNAAGVDVASVLRSLAKWSW